MQKIVLANWKANFSPERALQWCDAFAAVYQPRTDIEVVLAVPAFYLERVYQKIRNLAGVALAAQGVSPYPQGSYTGALPTAWLRGMVKYTLLGHRERRRYFHESVQDVARQVYESLAEELQPIVCIDRELLVPQTAAMAVEELGRLIWAYTPETTVALEMARSEEDIAAMMVQAARKTDNRPVLYGGGVTVANGKAIWHIPGVAGMLLGQGCLDAHAFAGLIKQL
jgi:triosephosphate isomerase